MIVVLAVLVFAVAYIVLMRRLTNKMRGTVEDMEALLTRTIESADRNGGVLSEDDCVPPIRIHLEPVQDETDVVDPLTQRIATWLRAHSFLPAGHFVIEELPQERLRVFLSEDHRLLAAIRTTEAAIEPYVEFCFDLGNRQCGGVGNPPASTLQLPDDAIGRFYSERLSDNFDLLSRMWLDAREMVDQHDVLPVRPNAIAEFFEEAHAAEMDNRIACGGVSETEIRSAFAAQGLEATEGDIVDLQTHWQTAIDKHILDFSSRSLNHVYAGDKILIVHDGSVARYLLNQVRSMLDELESPELLDQETLLDAFSELRTLLGKFPPREAIARFRPLLPAQLRYQLVDQLRRPVEADLYLLPKPQD